MKIYNSAMREMIHIKIAIYGKGGIGKSTISANISAALAEKGYRVLQIGCDPKHDSTRLLLGGKIPETVLQYIKTVLPDDRKAEDIVYRGYGNVACVEAGGPEPGVGCAGRGVITTFEFLESLGIQSSLFDFTLYDVLGDVVCGGFAVPIRSKYAEAIYIVTSGEYLSIYAANNILRGIQNFSDAGDRVAGIIYNARSLMDEDDRVTRFARAVHLPIIVRVPRSELFARAEKEGCTVIERYPESQEAVLFNALVEHVESIIPENSGNLYPALPLSDEDLEQIVLLRKDSKAANKFLFQSKKDDIPEKYLSESVRNKRPLMGCAFIGAMSVISQITDAAIVLHCPRGCSLMLTERLLYIEQDSAIRGYHTYNREMIGRYFVTDMADEDFIFGGEKKLRVALESAIGKGFSTIFIITSCPPGIIGDDIGKVSTDVSKCFPDLQIIPIKVDGNLTGDFDQGFMEAYRAVIGMISPDTSLKISRSVNIIAERGHGMNPEKNIQVIQDLIGSLGISLNCRFLTRSDVDSLRHYNDAKLSIPANQDDTTKSIKKMLAVVSDIPFLDQPLPTGFYETKEWFLAVAEIFGEDEKAHQIIETEREEYQKRIGRIRPFLKGKTILISTVLRKIDWICDLAEDLGIKILKIGVMNFPFPVPFTTRYEGRIPIVNNYTEDLYFDDIQSLKPDLILYNLHFMLPPDQVRSARIPMNPEIGFHAAIRQAEKWSILMQIPVIDGWKKDGVEVE